MIGCLKKQQKANRRAESKYFTPTDIIPGPFLPFYFSGAAYFMSKLAISKILLVRHTVPILHLDDVYIGNLIAQANMTDQMLQSVSICTGVHAFSAEYKDANNGWGLTEAPTNPCFMSGLTVFHRFIEPDEMTAAFNKLKSTNINKSCQQPGAISEITKRWSRAQHLKFIATAWQTVFDNYGSYGNDKDRI